jgi:indole-3-glycerol phosphate synthase
VLYKNFVIDEYQLFQARLCGASAALLIAACLSKKECAMLMARAHELGLEVLLEMHSEPELEYAETGADMCGINNRNLGTFITDVENSYRLAELLPKDACKVSESGISNPQTVKELRQAGFNGFLIGENFMKTPNPGEALRTFVREIEN